MHALPRAVPVDRQSAAAGRALAFRCRFALAQPQPRSSAAHGSHEVKQTIERDFEHVSRRWCSVTSRGRRQLQRKLMDEITRIEEDYKKTGEVPLPPPDWVKAIEAIAKIKASGRR